MLELYIFQDVNLRQISLCISEGVLPNRSTLPDHNKEEIKTDFNQTKQCTRNLAGNERVNSIGRWMIIRSR